MSNKVKIQCGGFYLGDGLTMDGDTLKSLSGAYVKVNTNDFITFEFMDDSPLKTFEEIRQKMETSVVTLLMYSPDNVYWLLYDGYIKNSITFSSFNVNVFENVLTVMHVLIDSDNKITISQSQYTLTPAT